MELGHHVDALVQVDRMDVPRMLFQVQANWFIDADSIAHVRRHHDHPDDVVATRGTLEQFIEAGHCPHERCETWVNAIGDEVIVAAQVATAIVQAWGLIEALSSGSKVLSRVEAINQLASPFDRVDTITGGHPLVDLYRNAAQSAYTDRQTSYIDDIRNARAQIEAAAVDNLALARGLFSELDTLLAGTNKAAHLAAQLPSTRNDLIRLRSRVHELTPTQISQFSVVPLAAVAARDHVDLSEALTSAWREAVTDTCARTIDTVRAFAKGLEAQPSWLVGIKSREGTLPIAYTAADLAHAFSWRPNAQLAVVPAAIAALLSTCSDWDLMELVGVPDAAVLEICETLWDPESVEFRRLPDAFAAASHL